MHDIISILKEAKAAIETAIGDSTTIPLSFTLNNNKFNSEPINLPAEGSTPGYVIESIIADILIKIKNENYYWEHYSQGSTFDLGCFDSRTNQLIFNVDVKSALKNSNAKASKKYDKTKEEFKNAYIIYCLYLTDALKTSIELRNDKIKIYNYTNMVTTRNRISNHTKTPLVENKLLYESIMRDVSKVVKKHLNENFNYWDTATRTWEVCDDPKVEEFFDNTIEFYEEWLAGEDENTIDILINTGKLSEGETDWYDAVDIVFEEFQKGLDAAVGGPWWETGEKLGYSDDDMDRLWNDVMQAKVDCVSDDIFPR